MPPTQTTDVGATTCRGRVAAGFEAVRESLDKHLDADPNLSVQLAVQWRDEMVVDLVGGSHLELESITGVYSVSKGVAAVALSP